MKTAISIPDDIFAGAELFASRRHISRSALYASAVRDFLARHGGDDVTQRLDEVYSAHPSKSDAGMKKMQRVALRRVEW